MSDVYEYLTVNVDSCGKVCNTVPENKRLATGDLPLTDLLKKHNSAFYGFFLNYVGNYGWLLVSSVASTINEGSVNYIFCRRK